MDSKHNFSMPTLVPHESDLVFSYLQQQQHHPEDKSSHSKKSKYTSSSKLTKSSLFRLILKRQDTRTLKIKQVDVQIHLLEGSLTNLQKQQQTNLAKFQQMTNQYIAKLDDLLRQQL